MFNFKDNTPAIERKDSVPACCGRLDHCRSFIEDGPVDNGPRVIKVEDHEAAV